MPPGFTSNRFFLQEGTENICVRAFFQPIETWPMSLANFAGTIVTGGKRFTTYMLLVRGLLMF